MKSSWSTQIVLGLAVFTAGTAWADGGSSRPLRQPVTATHVAYEYDNYLYPAAPTAEDAENSPSDQPAAVDETTLADVGCGESCAVDACGSCRQQRCCCDLGEPWTLPQPCALQSRGITVGGWIQAGIYGNAHGDRQSNGPLGFNDLSNGFNVNQLWLYAEREADNGGCGTAWGFRMDYVFGVDGPDTQAFGDQGWDFGWDSSSTYGSAIPQLYLELAYNDLSVKFGHFYTLIGYEVVPAPDNFFYSHAYTMYYAEPFTHTGFLAEHPLGEDITGYAGWTMGWDSGFENNNDASTFLGGLSFQLTERASLTWAVTAGDFGVGSGDVFMNSLVFDYALTDRLTYIFQHDLGDNSNLGAGDNEWYGINQYLLYQINDCWGAGLRFEWFRDDDGTRVITNNDGRYYGVTAGLNYRPHANVVLRPELRYDTFEGSVAGGQPFNENRSNTQFSGGFDVIFTF